MKHFIVLETPNSDNIVKLNKKDYKYLVLVRRFKKGDKLNIFLHGKELYTAEVFGIDNDKKTIELKILEKCKVSENEEVGAIDKKCEIVLMQWLIKGQRMDLAVRQATEAGVNAIFPVIGEFSVVKKETAGQLERKKRIIKEARQQSGSLIETKLFETGSLEPVLKNVNAYVEGKMAVFIMLTEKKLNNKTRGLFYCLSKDPEVVVLAIGCEGGISPAEESFLLKNNFQKIHFETNTLRAETAAIYSIAAVQSSTQMLREEKDGCKAN